MQRQAGLVFLRYPRTSEVERPVRRRKRGLMRWDSGYGCNSCSSVGLILVLLLSAISLPFQRVTRGPQNPSSKLLALGTVSPPMHYRFSGGHPFTLTGKSLPDVTDYFGYHPVHQGWDWLCRKVSKNFSYKKKKAPNPPVGPFPQTWGWQPGIAVIHCQSLKLRWGGKLLCYPWL